ncbi:aspartate 1-decarboxylase [Pseudomonas protegens]|uniref:aspartate 1-decarboxylase n=1 Tax=Pseudomonas protegens TaxID=380021 RepID=UPI001E596E00|nr:aspartate 1-decarboxylase [Pseudomonas protegens]MCD9572749.1 aspartate 1-decarboxylase [Pseudomonas protegens]
MYTIMFKAKIGDRATLCTYAPCSEAEPLGSRPRMLHMAPGNEQSLTSPAIADQVA